MIYNIFNDVWLNVISTALRCGAQRCTLVMFLLLSCQGDIESTMIIINYKIKYVQFQYIYFI